MPSARDWALTLLLRGQKTELFPDRMLWQLYEKHPNIPAIDRAFIQHLLFGVFRWRSRIDWVLEQCVHASLGKLSFRTLSILRLGAFQLLFLDKVPPSAAVNESVKLAKSGPEPWTGGLINGTLRTLCRIQASLAFPAPEDLPAYLTITQSHPLWLVDYWLKNLGSNETVALCEADNRIPPLNLRVNTLRISREDLLDRLKRQVGQVEPTPFSPVGLRVVQPQTPLHASKLYLEGLYQIQDEASQLIAYLLDPHPGERVLDLCAGFGGKTTHLAQVMKNQGTVLGVDVSSWKIRELSKNARRLGLRNIQVQTGDFLQGDFFKKNQPAFDRILVDAPCSGWGVIRRHPDLKWRIRLEDSARLAEQQNKFLQKAAEWLKPEGTLVYSTCTLCPVENEGVIERFLAGHPEFFLDSVAPFLPGPAKGLADPRGFYCAWPHRHGTDGFFAARLRRKY
jgi:16S rRNA (cytosine967-C5)-methyltransferase